jgi:cytoskeletal protein CcmA (bactofilin family)
MAKEKSGNMTVFGEETEFDGSLEFTDSLVITGKFKGTIKATGSLEIDKTAVCNVDKMSAESIVVSGQITGNIEGRERVELCNGSKVKGDIRTARLRIGDNVEFEGQVSMIEDVPDVDLFSVASAEYKNALILKTDEAR